MKKLSCAAGSISRDAAITFLLASHGTPRVGRPEDIGTVVAYLASAKQDFMQGCFIDIDGGATSSLKVAGAILRV
jgi:NAD(P)-dependent dehydrogenase (short-subunit alcohol dehydrogenase family)